VGAISVCRIAGRNEPSIGPAGERGGVDGALVLPRPRRRVRLLYPPVLFVLGIAALARGLIGKSNS